VGRTRLNVSAGIGAEHAGGLPPIRFLCPPEITVIRVVPAVAAVDRTPPAP
jgi:predicted MPP superfamily phosphohydrolase